MVWIHGGGFKFGDSTEMIYGPDYLLSKDIVFVSINYRLGVLGKNKLRIHSVLGAHIYIQISFTLKDS